MVAIRRNLVLACADWLDPVDLHQPPDPALANVEPNLFEFHGHPRTTIATEAEAVLFPDMCQHFHIRPLPPTDRSRAPGTIAALTNKHNTAEQFNGPSVPPAMHKSELHGLWLAKNCVAFFSTSLSSRSTRFSRRRRSFSRARSACGAATRSDGRYCYTHLPNVDLPIPKSDATRSRGNPLVSAIRTASCLNSSVCLIISSVSCCEL